MAFHHPDYCTCESCMDDVRRTMEAAHGFGWQLRPGPVEAAAAAETGDWSVSPAGRAEAPPVTAHLDRAPGELADSAEFVPRKPSNAEASS